MCCCWSSTHSLHFPSQLLVVLVVWSRLTTGKSANKRPQKPSVLSHTCYSIQMVFFKNLDFLRIPCDYLLGMSVWMHTVQPKYKAIVCNAIQFRMFLQTWVVNIYYTWRKPWKIMFCDMLCKLILFKNYTGSVGGKTRNTENEKVLQP